MYPNAGAYGGELIQTAPYLVNTPGPWVWNLLNGFHAFLTQMIYYACGLARGELLPVKKENSSLIVSCMPPLAFCLPPRVEAV